MTEGKRGHMEASIRDERRSGPRKRIRPGNVILQLCLLLVAGMQLYPLIWLVFFSFKDNIEIYSGNIMGMPQTWRFENYSKAFVDADIGVYLFNSVFVTAVTIAVSMLLAAMAAYAIARMRWKLSNVVFNLFLTGMMIPLHAALLPVFLVLKNMKLLNTHLALILPYIGFSLPLAILVFSNYMRTIPLEMEESAFIDGAGVFRTFFSIIIPLIKPVLATVAIFTYLNTWNELMFAVTLVNKQSLKTLTVGLMAMVGAHSTEWGPIGAGLVIATLPTILIYIFLSRQVQKSMIAGALKG